MANYTDVVKGQTFKHLDTTKLIAIKFVDQDGKFAKPNPDHKWVAKIAIQGNDISRFIGDFPAYPADDTKQLITHSSWEQGKTYRWTFEAKAAQPGGTIHTEMWGGGGFLTSKLTEEWKEYSSIGKPDPRYNMFYFWNVYDTGNIYLRNVKIYEA